MSANVLKAVTEYLMGNFEIVYELLKNEPKSSSKILSMLGTSCFFTGRFEESYNFLDMLFKGDLIDTYKLSDSLDKCFPNENQLYKTLQNMCIYDYIPKVKIHSNYEQSIERSNETYSELDELNNLRMLEINDESELKYQSFLERLIQDTTSNDHKKRGLAYFNLADIYYVQKQYDDAASCYKNAILNDPTKALYYGYASQVFLRINQIDYVMSLFTRRALDLDPKNPKWYMLHGIACAHLSQFYGNEFRKYARLIVEKGVKLCRSDQKSLKLAMENLLE